MLSHFTLNKTQVNQKNAETNFQGYQATPEPQTLPAHQQQGYLPTPPYSVLSDLLNKSHPDPEDKFFDPYKAEQLEIENEHLLPTQPQPSCCSARSTTAEKKDYRQMAGYGKYRPRPRGKKKQKEVDQKKKINKKIIKMLKMLQINAAALQA